MITGNAVPKMLFIVNAASGSNDTDWMELLNKHYSGANGRVILHPMPAACNIDAIRDKINLEQPEKVIAVGGDGTVKLVAEALLNTTIPLGIIPAGSANGMAKEFDIPAAIDKALHVIETGIAKQIHLVRINEQICIHLADVGFNAKVVKHFEEDNTRGMWGYVKSAFRVLLQHQRIHTRLQTAEQTITRSASMVVIANGTRYGNGVVINPMGSLVDDRFEVVVIRQISLLEIIKMRFKSSRLNQSKTELLQTQELQLNSNRYMHFQIDGEYLGKTKSVKAAIMPNAIHLIVPRNTVEGEGSTD